jgi:uncharacterized DUF497 family protein
MSMEYEWDEAKCLANIAKHKVDFNLAADFCWDTAITVEDDRFEYDEKRFIAIGFIDDRLHVLIFTFRDDVIRIISLRKANSREQRNYEKQTR